MTNEQLLRCAYWLGRARALASLSDDKEIAEMLDKAADCLCESEIRPARPPADRPPEPPSDEVEWI